MDTISKYRGESVATFRKKHLPTKSLEETRELLQNNEIFSMSEKNKINTKHYQRSFRSQFVSQLIFADLMDVQNYKIQSCKYILVMVDHYSRYLFMRRLTSKSAPVVAEAVSSVYDELIYHGHLPIEDPYTRNHLFYCDAGKEFFGIPHSLNTGYKPGVQRYVSRNDKVGASLAEINIRYIRQYLQASIKAGVIKKMHFYNSLQDISDYFNTERFIPGTKLSPTDVMNNKQYDKKIKVRNLKQNFQVDDRVRLKTILDPMKKKSENGYFTRFICRVVSVVKSPEGIYTYKLEPIDLPNTVVNRYYYDYELGKVGNLFEPEQFNGYNAKLFNLYQIVKT